MPDAPKKADLSTVTVIGLVAESIVFRAIETATVRK